MECDKQRIAIAEWCGWTECANGIYYENEIQWHPKHCNIYGKPPNSPYFCEVPYYLTDLNAIHEALRKLESRYWYTFRAELRLLCRMECESLDSLTAFMITLLAKPERLCEALLRTIGKWED